MKLASGLKGRHFKAWAEASIASAGPGQNRHFPPALQGRHLEYGLTLSWIAEKLNKGAAGSLANLPRKKK